MAMILKRKFFERPTLLVAPDLLGKFLIKRCGGREIVGMITEVEAYDGPDDKASHASKGRTARTEVMFGPSGYFYVYLCYGAHWMLNVVTGEEDYPAAILIRGVMILGKGSPSTSLRTYCPSVSLRKKFFDESHQKIFGPGRITKFFGIDKKLNGKIALPESGLWLEDRGVNLKALRARVKTKPRIGVQYAGKWAEKPWRFCL